MVSHIHDSFKEALDDPQWRQTAISEAEDGWAILRRKLGRDGVPPELQEIFAMLALVLQFPGPEESDADEKLKNLIEVLRTMLDEQPALKRTAVASINCG